METIFFNRIEGRTRKDDFQNALSLEIYDPLWMLCRQWQFGRFEANDCGSPITAKVKTSRKPLNLVTGKKSGNRYQSSSYNGESPLEYNVESMNCKITPYVRVESASHFKKLLKNSTRDAKYIIDLLKNLFPVNFSMADDEDNLLEEIKDRQNDTLQRFKACYAGRIFDGYELYLSAKEGKIPAEISAFGNMPEILKKYICWFEKSYPLETSTQECHWVERKLGYEAGLSNGNSHYRTEDYDSGNIEWHSFDLSKNSSGTVTATEKFLGVVPTPAYFPGSPARRLWEIEEGAINFGDNAGMTFSSLANAVIMEYVLMYSNDWMLLPVETEVGIVLDVEGIIVTDTFGETIFIDSTPEQNDKSYFCKNAKSEEQYKKRSFADRWSMFTAVSPNAYENKDFTCHNGLFFPPSVQSLQESAPMEQIQFVRDEMANMVWAVENRLPDGCGGTMDGKTFSRKVLNELDEQIAHDDVWMNDNVSYSFLMINRVPINWIPFLPMKIKGQIREIEFRRGSMPLYVNGNYQRVRPSTQILGIHKENGKVRAMYINEEEVAAYTNMVELRRQRARWFDGSSWLWIGADKKVDCFRANSGLLFDELIDVETNKGIKLKAQNPEF